MTFKSANAVAVFIVSFFVPTALAVIIETVTVGDPGNLGELSGAGAVGGSGPNRICGSVSYAYNIGKYEVTAGQYTELLNAVARRDTYGLYSSYMWSSDNGCKIRRSGISGSYTYTVATDYANRPVNYVNYWDACRFTNWLHNGQPVGGQGAGTTETGAYTLNGYNSWDGRTIQRNTDWKWAVTSEDEWYKAAYYKGGSANTGYWEYPTSSEMAPGQDMADVSGNNANYYPAPYTYPIDSGKYTTIGGEFQNSESPYGTFDQGGNVTELNETIVYQDALNVYRSSRGGSCNIYGTDLHASNRNHYSSPNGDGSGFVGFRVVQVPEPATLAMLALGGLVFRGYGTGTHLPPSPRRYSTTH